MDETPDAIGKVAPLLAGSANRFMQALPVSKLGGPLSAAGNGARREDVEAVTYAYRKQACAPSSSAATT